MRLLDRYLLRELLIPLGFCLSGFLLLWIVSDLFLMLSQFQSKGVTGLEIGQYYLVSTPEFLVQVLPIALLLALLYSLTNHARHHEITAMRAAGISLWRLALPYFILGLVISSASFALNELWVPDSSDAAEAILARHSPDKAGSRDKARQLGFTNSREGRIWQIGQYNPETGEMLKPEVRMRDPDGSWLLVRAERAEYTNDGWTFHNATGYRAAAHTNEPPSLVLQTNVLRLPQLTETPDLIKSEIKISSSLYLGRAKRADMPISELLNYLHLHPKPTRSEAAWLYTKLQGRLAAPWTCLVVVLIALPFGAASGRRNVFVGVASSILICFAYFVLQQLGLALGTGGYLAPWLAAWLPNLTFGLAGFLMTATVR